MGTLFVFSVMFVGWVLAKQPLPPEIRRALLFVWGGSGSLAMVLVVLSLNPGLLPMPKVAPGSQIGQVWIWTPFGLMLLFLFLCPLFWKDVAANPESWFHRPPRGNSDPTERWMGVVALLGGSLIAYLGTLTLWHPAFRQMSRALSYGTILLGLFIALVGLLPLLAAFVGWLRKQVRTSRQRLQE